MRKICSYCHEKLPSLESCTCEAIRYSHGSVPRIRFGDEEYDWGGASVQAVVFWWVVTTMNTASARSAPCAVSRY